MNVPIVARASNPQKSATSPREWISQNWVCLIWVMVGSTIVKNTRGSLRKVCPPLWPNSENLNCGTKLPIAMNSRLSRFLALMGPSTIHFSDYCFRPIQQITAGPGNRTPFFHFNQCVLVLSDTFVKTKLIFDFWRQRLATASIMGQV